MREHHFLNVSNSHFGFNHHSCAVDHFGGVSAYHVHTNDVRVVSVDDYFEYAVSALVLGDVSAAEFKGNGLNFYVESFSFADCSVSPTAATSGLV